ncbi:hypothetical protein [Halobacterium sp. R2-5]|uniref:hypothetical protein n=1 Tax=Halobacterium sp. R2-5 TaxID=2715751 RepID=UPI0014218A3B|nr:hypothetical protein [Halobacterium sp. R2-5]NIB99399.1 hypothetical protein [Halobacterium sp. R2-5]
MVNDNRPPEEDQGFGPSISRRAALTLLGLGALGSVASGETTASAEEVDTTGMSEELAQDEDVRAFIDEVLPGDKFGKIEIGEYQHALQQSGTRTPSWMIQPVNQDVRITNTSYEEVGSGIGYGVIPFPPGKVPILRLVAHVDAKPDAETSLRVSIANREAYSPPGVDGTRILEDDPVRQTLMEVTAQGQTQVFDELYLTDIEDVVTGLGNGHPLPSHTLLFEAKTNSPSGQVTLGSETTVALELEAL